MSIFNIILIAIGISMDAFSIAACEGMAASTYRGELPLPKRYSKRCTTPLLLALVLAFFQGMMPLIGYFAGSTLTSFSQRFAPWIALIILGYIGGKMIYEALKPEKYGARPIGFSLRKLLSLGIATSIDALVTGIVFVPYPDIVWKAIVIIMLTGFLLSMSGFLIGVRIGKRLRFNAKLLGGIDLILIGLKIFIEGMIG